MKCLKICFIALAVSCNSSSVKKAPVMQGAYFMTSQTVNSGDQTNKSTTLKQLKIYTAKFMMYAQVNPEDSSSRFGVGSYTTDTSGVTENVIYSSGDSSFDDSPATYKLDVTTNPDGYNQVISGMVIGGEKSTLTEEYQRSGTRVETPMDGVWKEMEAYNVNGNDTLRKKRTQYKAFFDGYFMFGHTLQDSSGTHTGIGFGTFSMDGNHKMKETDLNSTYSIIAGQSFMIDVELTGADHFKQTIVEPNGVKDVEIYERLK
ncbi:MAG: hypothetical protein ABI237_14560 [Ginsengibacter sp.]